MWLQNGCCLLKEQCEVMIMMFVNRFKAHVGYSGQKHGEIEDDGNC